MVTALVQQSPTHKAGRPGELPGVLGGPGGLGAGERREGPGWKHPTGWGRDKGEKEPGAVSAGRRQRRRGVVLHAEGTSLRIGGEIIPS